VWIKENNTWKLGYAQSTGSVVYNTPTLGGIFKVPDDIYELKITYPDFVNTANNYVSTRSMTVTPGQTVNYSIGDYGQMSSFGNVAVASFDKLVAKWAGDLDTWLYQLIGMVTGTNVISTSSLGDTAQLMSDVNAAGIYFYQDNIDFHESVNPFPGPSPHGSWNGLTGTIAISTVPTQFIQGPVRAYLSEAPVIAGGTTIIETQPTKENNYTVRLQTVDPSADPRISTHYYQLNLRQVMPITVAWGDWPPEDLYPVRASIKLVSVNGNTQTTTAYAGNPIVYSMTTTNFTSGTLYYSVSPVNVSIFDKAIASVNGNFTATSASGVLHTSFGEINVVNSRADATFTISTSTASFENILSPTLEYRIEVYKDRERTDGGSVGQSDLVRIISPEGSIITNRYCGTDGRFGGTKNNLYTVVADGAGGYRRTNEILDGCKPPDPLPSSNLNQETFSGGY